MRTVQRKDKLLERIMKSNTERVTKRSREEGRRDGEDRESQKKDTYHRAADNTCVFALSLLF